MFMTPETEPAEVPAISELTDQNELCERYKAPAPPARNTLAIRASATWLPHTRKKAQSSMATQARTHRPILCPAVVMSRSLTHPPTIEQMAIAINGSME